MNKRWRELAEKLMTEHEEHVNNFSIPTRKCRWDIEDRIAQAIETAVNEERARMEIVWPGAEWVANATSGFSDAEHRGALAMWIMLRDHAKIGVRE